MNVLLKLVLVVLCFSALFNGSANALLKQTKIKTDKSQSFDGYASCSTGSNAISISIPAMTLLDFGYYVYSDIKVDNTHNIFGEINWSTLALGTCVETNKQSYYRLGFYSNRFLVQNTGDTPNCQTLYIFPTTLQLTTGDTTPTWCQ